jgi:hypothetical protein
LNSLRMPVRPPKVAERARPVYSTSRKRPLNIVMSSNEAAS